LPYFSAFSSPIYLDAILVAHFKISFGSSIISVIPSNITKENGGV
jgi:hypothetical protein